MAVSEVQIGNMALGNIGVTDTIESFTESSKAARNVNTWYDFSRKFALEQFNWPFARKRVTLSSHADDAPSDWAYRYQYPSDCLAARHILNPFGTTADAIPFMIEMSENGETKSILCNQDEACLIYTFDQEAATLFTTSFVLLLAQELAVHLAMPMTAKRSIKQAAASEVRALVRMGMGHSANEQVASAPRDADWIRNRNNDTTNTQSGISDLVSGIAGAP